MSPITYPNARRETVGILRAALAASSSPLAAGVTVSARKPPEAGDGVEWRPYVRVSSDGRFTDSRLNGRASIRLVVWHTDDGLGEDLAALCEALLLDYHGPKVRSYGPLTGPNPTGDPDTGDPMTYVTVTARLQPEPVS